MYSRYVDVHRLVVFMASLLVDKAGPETLNLNPSVCLLLDVLDKHTLLLQRQRQQELGAAQKLHIPEARPPLL